jgi:hypothetical protein
LRGLSGSGFDDQFGQTDAVNPGILWESHHPLSIVGVLQTFQRGWFELAFKRLKSLVGLKGPPGTDAPSARSYVLAHLLMLLLLEPLIGALENSPRSAAA